MNFGCFSNKGTARSFGEIPIRLRSLFNLNICAKIFVSKFLLNMFAESVPPSFTFARHDSTRNAAVLSSHGSYSRNFLIIYKKYPTFSSLCRFCRRTSFCIFHSRRLPRSDGPSNSGFFWEERCCQRLRLTTITETKCCLFRLQSDHCWLLEASSLDYRVLLEKATNQHQDSIQHLWYIWQTSVTMRSVPYESHPLVCTAHSISLGYSPMSTIIDSFSSCDCIRPWKEISVKPANPELLLLQEIYK